MSTRSEPDKCNVCGSTNVRWSTSKATGQRYLQNTTSATAYDNGARYGRSPHFKTCAAEVVHRDDIAAQNKAYYHSQSVARLSARAFALYLDLAIFPAMNAGSISRTEAKDLMSAAKMTLNTRMERVVTLSEQ